MIREAIADRDGEAAAKENFRELNTICRATLRSKLDPSFRYNDFGFRLARSC
jgi:formylglycine-generating enzyme required for sulfatase activity